jgi:DNA polymerase III subunit gamma/tau
LNIADCGFRVADWQPASRQSALRNPQSEIILGKSMAYLVLARKYRSETFADVVGQEAIARTLTSAIEAGRIAQAYLFTGTRGVGKTTMARILAKALNCLSADGPTPKPCCKCDACQRIARGDDLDVIEIDGASNRGIDNIQELRAGVNLHPARCRFKVYYIDEVHQITRDAFNALLKTLEEPPAHVKFIFATTEPEKIPATILSRCQRFDFRNIPTRQIAAHLKAICHAEGVGAEDDALFRLARAAAGSMRDGISLLDQVLSACKEVTDAEVLRVLGALPEERVTAIAAAISEGKSAAAIGELAAVLEEGAQPASIATALGDYFRNMMLASVCGADSELIELTDAQRQTTAELAGRFSAPALVQAVAILQRLAFHVRSSSLARALTEAAIVRLAEADKFVDPQSLLEALEGGAAAQGAGAKPTGGVQTVARHAAPTASAARGPATAPPAAPAAASSAALPPRRARSAEELKGLSTAEKQEIQKDPAIREAMRLFGGEVVDMRRDAQPQEDADNSSGG